MRSHHIVSISVALVVGSAAYAQMPGNPAPAVPLGVPEQRSPDDRYEEMDRLRDRVAVREGAVRSKSPVPASPKDIKEGSDIRDSKGEMLGKVERVGEGFAVVSCDAGRVEVDFKSFAKNYQGLMINMRKAKFEAIVLGKH
jgi:hypothetical protein